MAQVAPDRQGQTRLGRRAGAEAIFVISSVWVLIFLAMSATTGFIASISALRPTHGDDLRWPTGGIVKLFGNSCGAVDVSEFGGER
jgi:hypothetical protein